MIARESASFFNCDYDPIHKEVRTAFCQNNVQQQNRRRRLKLGEPFYVVAAKDL